MWTVEKAAFNNDKQGSPGGLRMNNPPLKTWSIVSLSISGHSTQSVQATGFGSVQIVKDAKVYYRTIGI